MVYERPSDRVTIRGRPSVDGAAEPTLAARLLALVLPCPCLACGAEVWRARDSLGLCATCRSRLRSWPHGCALCGAEIAAPRPLGYRCGACRRSPPPWDRLVAGWAYQPPLDSVVTALKFRRLDYLGPQLGRALARRLADVMPGELATVDVVVPVPLHWRRRMARGYDQAELVSRGLAAALGRPCRRLLRRRRSTVPQSRLARAERLRGPRNAFAAPAPGRCRDRHVLLVDDVVTTGATVGAATAALLTAGAASVTVAAAALTPRDPQ